MPLTAALPVRLWRRFTQAMRGAAAPAASVRSYQAAAAHRLLGDWSGTASSANAATRYQAKPMRHRARELRENSAVVARYAALVRDNIIGPDGITLQAIVPSTRGANRLAGEAVEAGWYRWANAVTPDGRSLIDVFATLAESWRIEGEALLEVVPSPLAPMGLWLVPLDADVLDESLNADRTANGGSIVQGVEYDAAGRIVRYHLFVGHPSEGNRAHRTLGPDRLLRLAHRARPQQTRGITSLASVMVLINHLEKLQEALVVLNRTAASKMFAIEANEQASPMIDPTTNKAAEPQYEEVAPGNQWILPYGYTVKTLDPGQPTQEYDAFSRNLLREIASGLHVAYASLTGDLSDVNYSSIRAGLLVERDAWRGMQQEFIGAIVKPVFRWWLQTAAMTGDLAMPSGQSADAIVDASEWHPRRWAWVDPLKDAEGIRALLDMGLTTRTREANKQGMAFSELVEERQAEDQMLKDAGITLGAAPAPTSTALPVPEPQRQLRAV